MQPPNLFCKFMIDYGSFSNLKFEFISYNMLYRLCVWQWTNAQCHNSIIHLSIDLSLVCWNQQTNCEQITNHGCIRATKIITSFLKFSPANKSHNENNEDILHEWAITKLIHDTPIISFRFRKNLSMSFVSVHTRG